MSVPRPGSPDRQRLLPSTVEHSLHDLAIRFTGGAMVAFSATSWLALLSWRLRDASATGPAAKAAKNLLGSAGAGLSDMMVHTLGVAVVFALICPMIWGLELLASVRWIPGMRLKIVASIGAIAALTGTASGLPNVPGWPLLGGSGGMLGDLVHNLAASVVFRLGIDNPGTVTAAMLAAIGLFLLVKALGFGGGMLGALIGRKAKSVEPQEPVAAHVPAASKKPTSSPKAPAAESAVTSADEPATPPTAAPAATPKTPAAAPRPQPRRPLAPAVPSPREAPSYHDDDDDNVGRDGDFDDADDRESNAAARAFAERFAPGVNAGTTKDKPRIVPVLKAKLARARAEAAAYRKPSLNLLRHGTGTSGNADIDVETGAATLLEVLAAFGVKGEIREARPGPVVTRYELEPVRGTKIARVIGLADDFARELGANAVRVSVTPGRTTIGIEVPNALRETVVLRDILESDTFTAGQMQLPMALGKGIAGEPVVLDLARMPHLLVAGTTGSGKSVGLNAMILSLLYRLEPSELRLLLIDPKMLELSQYDRIPHLLNPVITDPTEAAQALEWAVTEMEERYRRMAQQSTRNIEGFNAKVRSAHSSGVGLTRTVQTGFDGATGRAIYERQHIDDAAMPYIVIVIDELADLMVTAGKRVEGLVQRLAQKARAAGIHLVMATQRPSVDVVTGTIKANLPMRISFRVASKIDSRTIINDVGAEQLLGHGDMLMTSGSGHHLRVHGAYVADEEIERVTQALREQGEPDYVDLSARPGASSGRRGGAGSNDSRLATEARNANQQAEEMYAAAVAVVAGDRKVSAGHLQRRLGIPEATGTELIERMEQEGLVGAANLFGRRAIHMKAPAPPRARSAA